MGECCFVKKLLLVKYHKDYCAEGRGASVKMFSWSDCCRMAWRGSGCRLSLDMLLPIIIQPVLVLLMSFYSCDSILVVTLACGFLLLFFNSLTRFGSGCEIFYYWTVSSITYVIIVFETVVVALSEIETEENFVLVLFIVFALVFLYFSRNVLEETTCHGYTRATGNGVPSETCSICRMKMSPRSFHCRICQICVPKYDYHCYWLNCCIGESNRHSFVAGIFFGVLALGYGSLLILTTICQPEFMQGVLLPKDCADVSATFGMFACFVSGVYCMELAVLLLLQLLHQLLLISRGYSGLEWKEKFGYNIFRSSPYSSGFFGNWLHFFKSFRKIRS